MYIEYCPVKSCSYAAPSPHPSRSERSECPWLRAPLKLSSRAAGLPLQAYQSPGAERSQQENIGSEQAIGISGIDTNRV